MEYQVLSKSLRFSQLENELQFKIIPTPGVFRNKYVQDDYASSSEYGMMTHDDDNALVHAFMMLDCIRCKSNQSHSHRYRDQLIDDLQNLLHCYNYGLRVRREETKTIISSMLAVKGCARPLASSILSYYENYYKGMAEEFDSDYHTEYSALNFTDLYIKAADKALFLDQDIDLAMQFYHLAGLWWGEIGRAHV